MDRPKSVIDQNHWIIITNPRAGKRSFQSQVSYVSKALSSKGFIYTLKVTEYAGHAIKIARYFANDGFKNFLILGGDGTINEVVNGIFTSNVKDKSNLKIAILPRGTGNDWARFWGIKKNTEKNLAHYYAGKSKIIDIGHIKYFIDNEEQQYYFINSIGFGVDANVAQLTNRLKKYVGSFSFLYTISLLIILTKLRTFPISLKIDGVQKKFRLLSMNIANGPFTGGGIKQNPDALPYDGLFDMMYVEKHTFTDILRLLPNLFNGKLKQHRRIHSFQAKNVDVEFEDLAFIEADGITLPKSKTYHVEILPAAIQMIIP